MSKKQHQIDVWIAVQRQIVADAKSKSAQREADERLQRMVVLRQRLLAGGHPIGGVWTDPPGDLGLDERRGAKWLDAHRMIPHQPAAEQANQNRSYRRREEWL
jgi:hypothetical protein